MPEKTNAPLKAIRGTRDILPRETARWEAVEATVRETARRYGFGEIRTPVFEATELFQRGVGETTDIVTKEMYTFRDKGNRSLTLRPEGTASVVRAYLEHRLDRSGDVVKLFYLAPMFRFERPQAGRLRQHHQFGVEVLGSPDAFYDVEVIRLLTDILRGVGLEGFALKLGSVGCPACRPVHRKKMLEVLRPRSAELCPTCRERLEVNPLRMFDCKNPACGEILASAPTVFSMLCSACREHFTFVRKGLDTMDLPVEVDERLVRGLDYYTRTAFEVVSPSLGAQDALGGGGRYDGLVELLGGDPTPGVGFGAGIERILQVLERQGGGDGERAPVPVAVLSLGAEALEGATKLLYDLRERGVPTDINVQERSLKAKMRWANRRGVRYVLLLGEEELKQGMVRLKNMETGGQEEVNLGGVAEVLERRLRKPSPVDEVKQDERG